MIWVNGQILLDDGLTINAADRTFEHGLGLFETLRARDGRAPLLGSHNARMLRSAEELRLPIDPSDLPDDAAVRTLLAADPIAGDRMLRITATGGTATTRSVVWMRSSPFPPPTRSGGAIVCVNSGSTVAIDRVPSLENFTVRHKTLNYWSNRMAFERARDLGYDETLRLDPQWGYTEASRSNLFLVMVDELVTITTDAPIVPGIMRRLILDLAASLPMRVRELGTLDPDRLGAATEVFLTNAVRGIIPVARVDRPGGSIDRPGPGPWTHRLQARLADRLDPGGRLP